jgi:hypothetical protein
MSQSRFRVRALAGGFALVLSMLLSTPAPAAALAPSCVDLNNNGVCDAGEPALVPLLNAGSFDTTVATGSYKQPTGAVGIVLNDLPLTANGLNLNATGNIVVNGKLKNADAKDVTMQSAGRIQLSPGAQLYYGRTHAGADGITLFADTIDLAAKSQIKVGGDNNFWDIEAENVPIGTSARLQAQGLNTEIDVLATASLAFGTNVQIKTSNSGTVSVLSQSSWDATGLKVTSDTIDLEADSPSGLPFAPQRTLALTNSNINQSASDGSLTISAGTPGAHSAVDQLTFTHTRIRSVAGSPDLEPTPTILP